MQKYRIWPVFLWWAVEQLPFVLPQIGQGRALFVETNLYIPLFGGLLAGLLDWRIAGIIQLADFLFLYFYSSFCSRTRLEFFFGIPPLLPAQACPLANRPRRLNPTPFAGSGLPAGQPPPTTRPFCWLRPARRPTATDNPPLLPKTLREWGGGALGV